MGIPPMYTKWRGCSILGGYEESHWNKLRDSVILKRAVGVKLENGVDCERIIQVKCEIWWQ
jgi:hypothetical protein